MNRPPRCQVTSQLVEICECSQHCSVAVRIARQKAGRILKAKPLRRCGVCQRRSETAQFRDRCTDPRYLICDECEARILEKNPEKAVA